MHKSSDTTGYTPENLFTALGGESPTYAFFTTFTFSPAVFQQKYVNPLLRHGCGNISVLTDPLGYSQSLSVAAFVEGVGTDYRLRAIPVKGSFHAKLAIIRCRGTMLVGVGSGNLTAAGLLTNAEVSALYRIQHGDTLHQLENLVTRLSQMAGLTSASGDESLPIKLADDTRLITSLDRPVFEQSDFPADVERVEIFSPFLDEQLAALKYIRDRWPSAQLWIHVDPEFGALYDALLDLGGNVEIRVPRQKANDESKTRRPMVHGKLMCFIGAESSTILIGSANLSRPAALSTDNFEAVVERRMDSAAAGQLLNVPKTQWRKATREDRKESRVFSSLRHVTPLTATAAAHQITVTWSKRQAAAAILTLTRCGRYIFTSPIEATESNEKTQTASVEIDESVKLDGPATAELRFVDGQVARGWIDNTDRLGATPAMKRQFSLLDAIASDPENCKVNEVADFIQELMRNLQRGQGGMQNRLSPKSEVSADDLDDIAFPRSATLVSGQLGNFDGDVLFEQLIRRRLKNAVAELTFFRSGQPSGGQHMAGSIDPEFSTSESESEQEKTGALPPKIATVLTKLFRQLAEAIELCDSAGSVAFLVRQIPPCLEAMQFAVKRWSAELHSTDLLSQHFEKVIIACCAPGVRSVFQRKGALALLGSEERGQWASFEPFAAGIAVLEAGLLIAFHTDPVNRRPLIRDMYDVIHGFRLPSAEQLQVVGESLWRLAGCGSTDAPEFSELRRHIEKVQGEESAVVACRAALREMIAESNLSFPDRQKLVDLSLQASNGNSALAKQLHTLIEDMGRHARLVEIPLDEDACPECNTMLPGSVHVQLKAPTVVKRCGGCGVLIARSLE